MGLKISTILICFFVILNLPAQQVRFNEVQASNNQFEDEDGDFSDWIEIQNLTGQSIDLTGWTLTDDIASPQKWSFGQTVLNPYELLLIWASDKDKSISGFPRTLINHGAAFRYLIPDASTSNNWMLPDFDDFNWATGSSGIGYGDGDDVTVISSGTSSVFLRKKFNVDDPDELLQLILHMDYDDAFVAYINGVEVARANIEGMQPGYNATAVSDHEAQIYQNGIPDRFDLDNFMDYILPGENLFCVQVHNNNTLSSDLSIIPFLTAVYSGPSSAGSTVPDVLGLQKPMLHTNFKISAEGESLYLTETGGGIVDSLSIPSMCAGISIGRRDLTDELVFYTESTPGSQNSSDYFVDIIDDVVMFSEPGGLVNELELELISSNPTAEIRYTTDASLPGEDDLLYAGPIEVSDNMVIRAKMFEEGQYSCGVSTESYLVNVDHDLDIVSLVSDPENLFDEDTGIYVFGDSFTNQYPFFGANFWEDWERPMHFSLYGKDGIERYTANAGAKIFGGYSRANDQRSFSLFARRVYGDKNFDHQLFKNRPYDKYESIVLRNAGHDWLFAMIRDVTMTSLMDGSIVDVQAFRPAVTYLNGTYWGIYNIREKINEHYIASKHQVDPDEIDLLEFGGNVIHGSNADYSALMTYISNNQLNGESAYAHVKSQMDIENFILYYVSQIYFDNTDWPGNNIKFWREEKGKWKWLLYDTDFGFGRFDPGAYAHNTIEFALEVNGPVWPNPPWSTFLFRNLVQNMAFRNQFINQFADELNSRFLISSVRNHIDITANRIASEIDDHYDRWGANGAEWSNQINALKIFASNRPFHVKNHIRDQFELPAYHRVNIENNDTHAGYVRLNSLTIKSSVWSGDYFESVPIRLTALARPGYRFVRWEGDYPSAEQIIEVDVKQVMKFIPIFEEMDSDDPGVIINEINYASAEDFDTGDWVEIYNRSKFARDISGWSIQDDNDEHKYMIPEGTTIPGYGYMVLAQSEAQCSYLHPTLDNIIGGYEFGFSDNGDAVRLFDRTGELVDEVIYTDAAPWTQEADGTGYTLELRHPDMPNQHGEHWATIHFHGSPGVTNLETTSTQEVAHMNVRVFPNPVSDVVLVDINLPADQEISIALFDLNGSVVDHVISSEFSLGQHRLSIPVSQLANGLFLLEIRTGNGRSQIHKIVKQ